MLSDFCFDGSGIDCFMNHQLVWQQKQQFLTPVKKYFNFNALHLILIGNSGLIEMLGQLKNKFFSIQEGITARFV